MPDGDPLDFSAQYNTPLSPQDEASYQGWVQQQSQATGRNVGNDTYDYDLRGWWKANPGVDLSGGHLTDQWKKPNHPTFSDQSQYNGVDGWQGGTWGHSDDGKSWWFSPGSTNLHSQDELKDYFDRVEPGNSLVLPAPSQPKTYGVPIGPFTLPSKVDLSPSGVLGFVADKLGEFAPKTAAAIRSFVDNESQKSDLFETTADEITRELEDAKMRLKNTKGQ